MPDPYGYIDPTKTSSQFNVIMMLIENMLAGISTIKAVKVISVTPGGIGPVGFVDVQPLVKQMNGGGQVMDNGVYHNIPYFRLQAGNAAVIMDPVIGDMGIMVCCDRDISSVKNARGTANPGSYAMMSASDGIYLGGILNGTPTTFVQIEDKKITVTPDSGITNISLVPGIITFTPDGGVTSVIVTPSLISITADVQVSGNITSKFGTANSVSLTGHTHTQPNDSHGDTEQPTAPPTPGT